MQQTEQLSQDQLQGKTENGRGGVAKEGDWGGRKGWMGISQLKGRISFWNRSCDASRPSQLLSVITRGLRQKAQTMT